MKRRFTHVTLLLILLGAGIAAVWAYLTGGPEKLGDLRRVDIKFLVLLLSITSFCVFVRFVRWQYVLRRVGVRVPTRPSLSIFLASLAGIATPAYVGEVVRCVFMRRRFATPLRTSVAVLVFERLLDVTVLALMAALATESGWLRLTMLLLVAVTPLVGIVAANLGVSAGVPREVIAQLAARPTLARAFLASLVAWIFTAFLITVAAAGLQIRVPAVASLGIFSTATLLGGLTLMPAGVGTMGSVAILALQRLGVALPDAVLVVSLVRLATVGFAIAVSGVFLLVELNDLRRPQASTGVAHFDEVAHEYQEQLPEHLWNYLLERKIGMSTAALRDLSRQHLGLDLGCGLGRQCLELARRGYSAIGVDASHEMLQHARRAGATVSRANALTLPFRDASFDFVVTVGVLHHLGASAEQDAACREVLRVLKPGGLFLVHETNPLNPLFRFYMGYVFPLLRSIDLGTEWWIAPQRWEEATGFRLVRTDYFTFLPDFMPQRLAGAFRFLERGLEASPLRRFSVHYMATMQKSLPPGMPSQGAPAASSQVPKMPTTL